MSDQTAVAGTGIPAKMPEEDRNATFESTQDPIKALVEIATNNRLSDSQKRELTALANNRFRNRRRMAYISLWTIVAAIAFLGIASAVDGITGTTTISEKLADNDTIISFALAFLTGLVAAYYGVSAWRPRS